MKLQYRRNAELLTDFPNDTVEDEFEIIVFGGRGVAEAIAQIFRRLGYEVEGPEYAGEHGWDFIVKTHKDPIVFQVTDFADGNYVLMSYPARPRRLSSWQAVLLVELNAELATDSRFKKVGWFDDDTLLSKTPGHEGPLDEADLPALMLERDRLFESALKAAESRRAKARGDNADELRGGLLSRLLAPFRSRG